MFPSELAQRSYKASNGELAWSRQDAGLAIAILVQQQHAILGGELWWVPDGAHEWTGLIPQRQGPDAAYPWETTRAVTEDWPDFVVRCAENSLKAIERWPAVEDLPTRLGGRILYNLTWVSEREYRELRADAV